MVAGEFANKPNRGQPTRGHHALGAGMPKQGVGAAAVPCPRGREGQERQQVPSNRQKIFIGIAEVSANGSNKRMAWNSFVTSTTFSALPPRGRCDGRVGEVYILGNPRHWQWNSEGSNHHKPLQFNHSCQA